MFDLLRIILVPLELFAVATAIVFSISGNFYWATGLVIYMIWMLYSGGIGGTLLNLFTSSIMAIAYLIGGWIWAVVSLVIIVAVYEVFYRYSQNN